MTNGEWLRQQGDDELAEIIAECEAYRRVTMIVGNSSYIVKEIILKWLEAEHIENDKDNE